MRLLRRGAALAGAAGCYLANSHRASSESASTTTQSIVLRDGRRLAFNVVGTGVPVYAFHGMGSSHLTWTSKPLPCEGVQLIALDRPGYGDSSDPPAAYSYTGFVRDLEQLADALGTPTFCVAGHSSGGPYALAAAALLPERVTACAAVASDPPYAHPLAPEWMRAEGNDMGGATYGAEPLARFGGWRAGDLAKGAAAKLHAWKGGAVGFVMDFMLERLPWSFRIEDIKLGSRLTFWVGTEDAASMTKGAPWMQSVVPGSRLEVVQGGNHGFKSEPRHLKAILEELVAASTR